MNSEKTQRNTAPSATTKSKSMDNLTPFPQHSKEAHKKIASAGGKASGKARRRRKALREELEILLATGDTQKKMCLAMIQKAINGDIRAFAEVFDRVEGKPTTRAEEREVEDLSPLVELLRIDPER